MKKILLKYILLITIICFAIPAFAQTRIVDNAGLLNESEKAALTSLIDSISTKYNFDLVIVTEKSIGTVMPMDYADDFFDYNGYGLGQDRDGCLFLQVTESRDYWFGTSGRGIKIMNETAGRKLESDAVKHLSSGSAYQAYNSFLINWENFLSLDAKGRRYNFIQQWNIVIMIIAWAVALGIGFIVVLVWKKGMNTALAQTQAAAYVVPGSLSFKVKKDTFLYSTVTKTARETSSTSSGGGGRSHTSSSGRSHGGRGGKY